MIGEITFRQFLGGGGYTITLSFDSYKITYCHCDPTNGATTGPHLHLGIRIDGKYQNPLDYF